MKNKDVVENMKVVPFRKSVKKWNDINDSWEWKRACAHGQNYLFVVGKEKSNPRAWILAENKNNDLNGDFYNASDFEPYREEQNGMS